LFKQGPTRCLLINANEFERSANLTRKSGRGNMPERPDFLVELQGALGHTFAIGEHMVGR
jgi:hypothetical protein